jgi:hypothetical protein
VRKRHILKDKLQIAEMDITEEEEGIYSIPVASCVKNERPHL